MIFFNAFLVAGTFCLLAEVLMDNTKLTPGHITAIFVCIGAFLDTFSIYDFFIAKVGGGALLPITSFGHSLIHGALLAAESHGIIGLLMGIFDLTAAGITAAIIFTFAFTLIFKAKD